MKRTLILAAASLLALAPVVSSAQPYYFVGPAGGDFFDEGNWNDAADGTGAFLAGDPLFDSASAAIDLDLIIDGDVVVANGEVDFGPGSLSLGSGSLLLISGAGSDLDINSNSTFSLTEATLIVDDVINFEGTSTFSGGSVQSLFDDIAFQDNFDNLTINGTLFTAFDNIYFDGFNGSITGASFDSGDRLGVRNSVGVVMTDSVLVIQDGTGDIDDVFAAAGAGSSLTLLGNSVLVADSVEEGAQLFLGGSTDALMGGQGERIVTTDSLITMTTTDAILSIATLDPMGVDYVDARPYLVNGLTGQTYAENPFTWNVSNWDGFSAVTLQVRVPEPSAAAVLLIGAVAAPRRRRV